MPTTWNPADNSDATLSGGDLVAAFGTTPAFHSCRATTFKNTGKWYFEDTLQLSTAPNGALWLCGVGNSSADLGSFAGSSAESAGFENNGQLTFNGSGTPTSWAPAALGDVIGFAIDIDNGRFWVKDVTSGSVWNIVGDVANPVTGVGGFNISTIPNRLTTGLTIMCSGYFTSSPPTAETHVLNTGATAFAGVVPSGFAAWDASGASTADLPPPWSRSRAAAGVLIARPQVAWNMVLGTGLAPLVAPAPDEVRYNPLPLWGPLLAQ